MTVYEPTVLFPKLITPVVELISNPAGVAVNVPPEVNPVANDGVGFVVEVLQTGVV